MYRISGVFLGVVMASSAVAATQPRPIQVGGGEFIPTLLIEHEHDDNIFMTDAAEESSTVTRLAPTLAYENYDSLTNYFEISYSGDYARYWQSRDDDFDDHSIDVGVGFGNDMLQVALSGAVERLHDNRGEGGAEGLGVLSRDEPDEYDQNTIGMNINFGREDAKFGAQLITERLDKEYTNNRATTRVLDRDETLIEGRLVARVSPRTEFYGGYRTNKISYDNLNQAGATLDSDEDAFVLGVTWQATAKTTGSIEVGRQEKDFDDPLVSTEDSTIWNVAVNWAPRTYSTFDFSASQDVDESNAAGSAQETRSYGVTWNHTWSDRLASNVGANTQDADFIGIAREDETDTYSIGLTYDWQRWLSMALQVEWSERDSNDNTLDYDRRVVLLSVDLSL